MNPFLEESGPCAFCNKVLHFLEFVYPAGFESARVVKDKVLVASEDHLVFDVVDSALVTCQMNGIYGDTVTHLPRFLDLCMIDLIANRQCSAESKVQKYDGTLFPLSS